MQQTLPHEQHNPDLLMLIPAESSSVIEIGTGSGALAREFKKINPNCDYVGIDLEESCSALASRYCDRALTMNIEHAGDDFFIENRTRDCWVFGDTLEHLQDPWGVLRKIRSVIPDNACIVACIPNAQHWVVQAKLSVGDFRYQDHGLLDRSHLRWFTRQTIIELFDLTGFELVGLYPRIFNEPMRDEYLPLIGAIAEKAGCNRQMAIDDAKPLQYLVRAIPKKMA